MRVCDRKRGRISWKKNRKSVIEKERERQIDSTGREGKDNKKVQGDVS